MTVAERVRGRTAPNPWVGAVVVPADGAQGTGGIDAADVKTDASVGDGAGPGWFEGATAPIGGPHAEVTALHAAGERARGATLYVTLEPCAHHGRTPPCVEAVLAAGVARVVVGMVDPDPRVAGRGVAALTAAGVDVEVAGGATAAAVADQLTAYVHHRRTGRPYVVLKLASTLDGRTAAPDGSSRWITGEEARRDVHRLRSSGDAVLVGAGTVRADDPQLTVRLPADDPWHRADGDQPRRFVLGSVPPGAAVRPAREVGGELGPVLDDLGADGVVQLLVEGGPSVAHAFHAAGLVDRYVLYLAPALFGGDDGRPLFAGPGAPTMAGLWRGRLVAVTSLGADLRVDLAPVTGSP